MNFLAIDVETANADYSSICQIGIAEFENDQIVTRWSTLVNPETYFDPFNVSIHGIDEKQVRDAPTFDKLHNELISRIQNKITVHHMPFDKIAISRACQEYNLELINAIWLDSAKIARRTWDQFAYKGYGLANIAKHLNIEFMHHDALEDAITAGKIVIEACALKNFTAEHWLERIRKPIHQGNTGYSFDQLNANVDGSLYGEILVFTGALFLPRIEAAKIAADLGCEVGNSISTKTTMLVVGTQDSSKLVGYEKSSKHRKAEELINIGFPIKILSEKDFIEICNSANSDLNLEPRIMEPNLENQKKEKQNEIKEKPILSFEINIDKVLEDLTEEQRDNLFKRDDELQKIIDSIQDCDHEEKRRLAKEFNSSIKIINDSYVQFDIESFEDNEIDILCTIESEIDQLHDSTYDLMKNKISLSDFFEYLIDSIDDISSDIEEADMPIKIEQYVNVTLHELKKMSETIKTISNNMEH